MVAFVTHLTALGNDEGTDKIVGQIDGEVDLQKLRDAKLLYEHEGADGTRKKTAVVLRDNFAQFIADGEWGEETRAWFEGVARNTWLVVVHNYEWESGLNS